MYRPQAIFVAKIQEENSRPISLGLLIEKPINYNFSKANSLTKV